jgi:hypothetical protein
METAATDDWSCKEACAVGIRGHRGYAGIPDSSRTSGVGDSSRIMMRLPSRLRGLKAGAGK